MSARRPMHARAALTLHPPSCPVLEPSAPALPGTKPAPPECQRRGPLFAPPLHELPPQRQPPPLPPQPWGPARRPVATMAGCPNCQRLSRSHPPQREAQRAPPAVPRSGRPGERAPREALREHRAPRVFWPPRPGPRLSRGHRNPRCPSRRHVCAGAGAGCAAPRPAGTPTGGRQVALGMRSSRALRRRPRCRQRGAPPLSRGALEGRPWTRASPGRRAAILSGTASLARRASAQS
mmetsp:Transcript_48653/g.152938  ORF Transcript_48653/g.152938 Transcript_48653/m.152938 type:complete len:236 (+) Transcript_48653:1-708(+)